MNWMRYLKLASMILALLGAVHAPAAEKVRTQYNVSFVSGGVGIDSEERLKGQEKEFNLKLVFTLVEGNYLADVDVVIRDASGSTVLRHETPGPLFMARLPRGTYNVSATYEGKTHSRRVTVSDRLRTEYFRWPSNPLIDFPLSDASKR